MNYRHKCTLQRFNGYAMEQCNGVLLKFTSTGGLEVKCHKCRQIQMVHRSVLEQYRVADRLDYATEG